MRRRVLKLRDHASALAIAVMVAAGVAMIAVAVMPDPVWAMNGQGQGQGQGGPQGAGNGDANGGGKGAGGGNGGSTGGGQGAGAGAAPVAPAVPVAPLSDEGDDGEDGPDGRGPRYGKPDPGSNGGVPVWGDEGIPEVELGRLNVARAPAKVLNQAFAEALNEATADMVTLYEMDIGDAAAYLAANWDDISLIDAPLQNLALLRDVLDGTSTFADQLGIVNDPETLAALFLGVASDKTLPITEDTVVAITTILGFPGLDSAFLSDLAADAEAIRQAVLIGHG